MIEMDKLSQPPFSGKTFAKKWANLTACIALGAAVGFGLSHLPKTQWRASAQFDLPTVSELGNYYSLASTYLLLQGDSQANHDQRLSEKSYAEFKRNLLSPDLQRAFFREKVADYALQFDDKTQRLSLTLDNPNQVEPLLNAFVEQANKRSRVVLNGELIDKWKVLFQQVKSAAEHNLGAIQLGSQVAQQDWSGKLKLMKSVQPLDDKLTAYRFIESPVTPQSPHSPDKWLWAMIGAVAGLVLGLFRLSLSSFHRQ